MILADLPMRQRRRSLQELWDYGRTRWRGYTICYVPRKSFSVSHARSGRRYSAYDVIGFFQTKFENAVKEWCHEIPAIITEGKAGRESFNTWPMEKIIEYNAEECRLLVEVMSRFREALRTAGLFVRRWDGAGAIAAAWLRRNEADRFYGQVPQGMLDPLSRTFFGGRSDIIGVGHTDCYYSDINSAYPAAMCEVPDMSSLIWIHDNRPKEVNPYGIYRVEWKIPTGEMWGPFPWRWPAGSISFPLVGTGWYIGIEVLASLRRFGNRRIRVMEGWQPDGSLEFPLDSLIRHDYAQRQILKQQKAPANVPIKLGLNSLYGKCMQRQGWGGKPPRWKNIYWGAFITAHTRAKISDTIEVGNVIACATDGIFHRNPLPKGMLTDDNTLGTWEHEKDVASISILGAGVYETYDTNGGSLAHKQRGFGNVDIDYFDVLRAWEVLPGDSSWAGYYNVRRFVGIGIALRQHKRWGPEFGRFVDMPRELADPSIVGTPKRLPSLRGRVEGGLRTMIPAQVPIGVLSHPYKFGMHDAIANEKLADAESIGD